MNSVKEISKIHPLAGKTVPVLSGIAFLSLLYLISRYNYLIFHNIAEMFSIVIAFSIFLFAWNSKRYFDNFCFVFLGIAYFHVGFLDSIHTLSYEGMPFFPAGTYYATQLWIATRFLESLSLLVAFSFLSTKRKINPAFVFFAFSAMTALIIGSVYYWNIFPIVFIKGKGLTPFKIISEYIICFIIILAIIRLYRHREDFDGKVFNYLLSSLVFTILAELFFTFYISMYGFSNLLGHFCKIISFKFIYESIIATGLNKPYDLLFRKLKEREDELIEANRTKDKFFSIISHDLKNPFTSLIGFSAALTENYENINEDTKKEFIKEIHDSAEQIYDLLDNLLNWSLTQTGSITHSPEKINFPSLAEKNITLMQRSAELKKIALTSNMESDTFIFADANMVNTVIRNLLSNAIKFTGNGGKVTVSSKRKEHFLEVTVSDTGIGISEENAKNIFQTDMRHLSMGTARETGTGMGLILCKDFIDRHGGKLWVESKPGIGSMFSFTLPLAQESTT